jgi:hypothetical protein
VLALDRMAIEEAGPNPERLAAAIHDQLRHKGGEVRSPELRATDLLGDRD